jgi:glycosyltransferase involved in cell wall biosynthesis
VTHDSLIDIALINNSQTPYRLAFHRRLARELKGARIHSVFTHDVSSFAWTIDNPDEINPIVFGPGEVAINQSRPSYAFHELRKAGRIIDWMKANHVRAVILGGYNDPGYLRIMNWCRRSGVPCLLFGDSNIRDDNVTGWRRLVKNTLLAFVVRSCAAFFACGSLGRAYYERYGVPVNNIFYTPYEPDYELIADIPSSLVDEVSRSHGLSPGRRRIVFSGRFIPVKRADLLIAAFCEIAEERPEWDLVMVGDGPQRAELQALVPRAYAHRVIWTGFLANQRDVSAIYRASDVLALPSRKEPWALVVNEAAAAGMAIVCSDVVGAGAELVRDDVNGFVFPASAPQATVADCLRKVTAPDRIDFYKCNSPHVLAAWRREADPVDGLRKALRFVGVIA